MNLNHECRVVDLNFEKVKVRKSRSYKDNG